jgi:hypothetical protein
MEKKRTKTICIRLEPNNLRFLKQNSYSPTRVMDEAIEKLKVKRGKNW